MIVKYLLRKLNKVQGNCLKLFGLYIFFTMIIQPKILVFTLNIPQINFVTNDNELKLW